MSKTNHLSSSLHNIRIIWYRKSDEFFIYNNITLDALYIKKNIARNNLLKTKNVIIYNGNPLERVGISVTGKCNLDCLHCFRGGSINSQIPLKSLKRTFSKLNEMGVLTVAISGGEPFMRKDIIEILKIAQQNALAIDLITNGTLITKEVANELAKINLYMIHVALDGATPQTHDKFRGRIGAYKKTTNAIKLLTDFGIPVSVSTMLHNDSLTELNRMLVLLDNWNIKQWGLIHPQIYGRCLMNWGTIEPEPKKLIESLLHLKDIVRMNPPEFLISTDQSFIWRCIMEPNQAINMNKKSNRLCDFKERYLNIDSSGYVRPCEISPTILGNITKTDIHEIWEQYPGKISSFYSISMTCKSCYYYKRGICGVNMPICPMIPCNAWLRNVVSYIDEYWKSMGI